MGLASRVQTARPLAFLFDIAQNSHIVMLHLTKNYVALWHGLVRVFPPCECDLKKVGWNTNPNGWFAALDVTSTKCKRSRHLIIMNNRGAAFYFWLFFYFLILFVVCRLWVLVCIFMECQHSDQELAMERCFHDSLLWSDKDDVEWWTVCLRLEVEDKSWTMMKLRNSAFHTFSWFFN
jgi:hypothetical protein